MKRAIATAAILLMAFAAQAQKVFTKNGNISFHSKASLETIEATSNQVTSVLVPATGDIQFSVQVKSFHFKKALMEEHFNENYLESDKYPKSTFKGKINDVAKVDFTKDGTYNVTVSGDLNMHNVTQKTTATGTITVKSGKISAASSFVVKLADYKIDIPNVVRNNIAETVTIKVTCTYDQKL
jgi:polyisoprenoid-binding protein YceI